MKTLCLRMVLLLICCALVLSGCDKKPAPKKIDNQIETFSLSDYADELEAFSKSIKVEPVTDYQSAVACAKSVWQDIFDQEESCDEYRVCYDESTDSWLVLGVLPDNMVGGVPYAVIDGSENMVIAVWHTK